MEFLNYSLKYNQREFDHFKRLAFFKNGINTKNRSSSQYQLIFNAIEQFSIDLYTEEDYWGNFKILERKSAWEGKIWVGRSIIWTNELDREEKISLLVNELNNISHVQNDIEFFMRMRMVMNCYEIIYGKPAVYFHGLYQEEFYIESKFDFNIKVEIAKKSNFEDLNQVQLQCKIKSNAAIPKKYKFFRILVIRRKSKLLSTFYKDNIMPPHLLIASNKKLEEAVIEVTSTLNNLRAGKLFELIAKLSAFTNDFKNDLPNNSSRESNLYKLEITFDNKTE